MTTFEAYKIVKIRKQLDSFEYPKWNIFQIYTCHYLKNYAVMARPSDYGYLHSFIPKLIMHSKEIHIIAADDFLSAAMIGSLKSALKAKIKVIVKSTDMLKTYKKLGIKFDKTEVDEKLIISHIACIGYTEDDSRYYFVKQNGTVTPTFLETSSAYDNLFFKSTERNRQVPCFDDFLNSIDISGVFIFQSRQYMLADKMYSLVNDFISRDIDPKIIYLSIPYTSYDEYAYNQLSKKINGPVNICVNSSIDNNCNGVYLISKNHSVYKLTFDIDTGDLVLLQKIDVGLNTIKELELFVITSECDDMSYSVSDQTMVKTKTLDSTDVHIKVRCKTLDDYINEKFDRSETNNLEKYKGLATKVNFIYTVRPPIDYINHPSLYETPEMFNELNIKIAEYESLMAIDNFSGFKIEPFCETLKDLLPLKREYIGELEMLTASMRSLENHFNIYRATQALPSESILICEDITLRIKYFKTIYREMCKELYIAGISKEFKDKLDKIIIEINEYDRLIKEKQSLINLGIDVLSNKQRIKVLSEKSEKLRKIVEVNTERNNASHANEISSFENIINTHVSNIENNEMVEFVIQTDLESTIIAFIGWLFNMELFFNKKFKPAELPLDVKVKKDTRDGENYFVVHYGINDNDATRNYNNISKMREKFKFKTILEN